MTDLLNRMYSSVEKAETAAQATFDVLTGAVDVPVDVDGIMVPTLATRVRDFIADSGSLDGEDGKSLEFIEIRPDGHLWAKIEDQPEVDLGQIVPDAPTAVSYVQYDDVTGDLEIGLTDGSIYGPFNVKGEDSAEVVEAFIENGNLKLRMSDNFILDAGDITRFGGAGANGADITESGDLIILFSDGTTQNVGRVRGEKGDNGVSLVSAGIDQFGILRFLRSDGRTATAGLVNATILDSSGNTVIDVRLGGVDNKELIVELTDTVLNLGKVVGDDGEDGDDGNDGVSITAIRTENDHLLIDLSNGTTHDAGPIQVTRIYNAGNVSIGNAHIDTNGHLIIRFDNDGQEETVDVGKVVGEDGTKLVSAEINENSELVFTDGDGETINAGEVEQVTVTSADIDEDGHLVIGLSDGTSFTSTESVKGADGADAVGIESVSINNDGELIISYEGSELADANLGRIILPVETNVSLVDGEELTFTLSNGDTFGPFVVKGRDGIYVTEMTVEEGRVFATFSNNESVSVDLGKVEQDPTSAVINPDGTLTIEFDDGTSITTTERVQALDGDGIASISYNENSNSLTIDYTTGNRTGSGQTVIDDLVGYGITEIRIANQWPEEPEPEEEVVEAPHIVIETNIPDNEEIVFIAPKGVDGASVVGFERRDNDLVIKYQERGEYSFEDKEFIAEGIYTEGSIEHIAIDANGDLVIEVDILEEPLVFPTLKGADGNTITDISLVGAEGRDLQITTSQEETVTIPMVRGADGVTIEEIGVEGTDLVIKVSDQGEDLIFPQEKGFDAQEAITSITLGGDEGRDLIIEKTSETLTVPLLKGEDGNSIDNIEIDENNVLTIELSDSENVSFDMNTLRGIDGNSVTEVIIDGNDLVIRTNMDAPNDEFVITGVKGKDGNTIQSVDIAANDRDFTITMSDDSTFTLVDAAVRITGASIVDRKLVLDLSDGTTLTTSEDVVGRDGNGVGVVDVEFVDGSLSVTLAGADDNETVIDAGNVSMVGVSGARIETDSELNTGILWIDFDNGTSIEVGNVYGENGRYVTSVDLEPNAEDPSKSDLVLTFNDGGSINAGVASGEAGRSVVGAEVAFGGDMIFEYSDGSFENIGNIGTGGGLSIWNPDNTPYAKDQVVIHEGGLYMSLIPLNNDEPPSDNWIALALGDQITAIRKPVCISPVDGETAYSQRPRLTGTPYAPIVSSDARDYREFQIDLLAGDFSNPVYSAQVDSDSHEISGTDLAISSSYKWRIRDVSLRGDESEWSEEESFYIPAGVAATPVVALDENESMDAVFVSPKWVTSEFAISIGDDVHVQTDWQIETSSGVLVWESLNDTVNLESVIVPYGFLDKGENYRVRAKHRGNDSESGWSDWVNFTVSTMEYIEVPTITRIDDLNFESSIFKKTPEFAEFDSIALGFVESIWRFIKVDTGEIAVEVHNNSYATYAEFFMNQDIELNVQYRVTVEYVSDRFGSVQSDPFAIIIEFTRNIEKPVISTEEDINAFPQQGILNGSSFVALNETHVSSDWEMRDINTDEILWSSYDNEGDRNSISVIFPTRAANSDVKVRVRYRGEFIVSEWSDYIDLFTALEIPGPGGNVLLVGDTNAGFAGEVPVSELFTGTELASAIGLSAGTSQHTNEPWLKFVLDGEILYVAKKPYRYGVSWNDINAVYNNEGSQVVSKDGYDFRVTLLRGANEDPSSAVNGDNPEGTELSEWNRLMYKVHVDDPEGTPWVNYTDADIIVGSGNGRGSWCQETNANNADRRVRRGGASLVNLVWGVSSSSNAAYGWRPALRLLI